MAAELQQKGLCATEEDVGTFTIADSTNSCRIFMFAIEQIGSVLDRHRSPDPVIVPLAHIHIFLRCLAGSGIRPKVCDPPSLAVFGAAEGFLSTGRAR